MRILVTGGLGFVGSNLTRRLLQEGHEVTVFDNLTRAKDFGLRVMNEFVSGYPESFKAILQDIRSEEAIRNAVREQEAVFHLAAVVNVRVSVEQPKVTSDINIGGTVSILDACRNSGVREFVFASSLAVYGHPKYLPYDEEHPTNPLSPYAVSKLTGEHLTRIFGELYGMNTVTLRFSNIYGTGGAGVISIFLDRIANNSSITVFGGDQTDDFIHVNDAVKAYVLALEYPRNGTFNIGSGHCTSINALVSMLKEILGREITVLYEPPKKGEIKDSGLSFEKASRLLGYRPEVSLRDGIRMMCRDIGLLP